MRSVEIEADAITVVEHFNAASEPPVFGDLVIAVRPATNDATFLVLREAMDWIGANKENT